MPKRLGNTQIPSAAGLSDIINLKQHKQYVEQDIFPSPENDVLSGLRFDGNSYLSRTFGTATKNKKWTFSAWVKISKHTGLSPLMEAFTGGSDQYHSIFLDASGQFSTTMDTGGGGVLSVGSTGLLRDFSAWYHLILAYDTIDSSLNLNHRFYINGVDRTETTSISYTGNPYINSTNPHRIGFRWGTISTTYGQVLNGYLANVHFIDGQALDPSHFGYYNRSSRQWKPKKYTGTYGGNGFYLPMKTDKYMARFNGTNTQITGGNFNTNNILSNTPFTIAFWVRQKTGFANDRFFSATSMGGTSDGFFIRSMTSAGDPASSSYNMDLTLDQTNGRAISYFPWKVQEGEWSFVTLTWDGTITSNKVIAYVNGVVNNTGTGALAAGTLIHTYNFKFGSAPNGTSNLYDGSFAQYAIWHRELTSQEVSDLYNLGINGDFSSIHNGDLQVYYTLNNVSTYATKDTTTIVNDRSTNSINLTPSNFSSFPMLNAGFDESSNRNDWDTIEIYHYDSVPDSQTNNFATWNPLYKGSDTTISNGNLNVASSSTGGRSVISTIAFDIETDNFYCELLINSTGSTFGIIGIESPDVTNYIGYSNTSYGYSTNGGIYHNNSSTSYGATYTTNDVIGMSGGSGAITFYKNGVSQGVAVSGLSGKFYVGVGALTMDNYINFGQDPTFGGAKSPSTTYIDANGIGSFYYQPPDGALALCTANLPRSVIEDPADYFKAVTYTGSYPNANSVNVGFNPDLIWLKSRTQQYPHGVWDTIRTVSGYEFLSTNNTNAEGTSGDAISFITNGFRVDTGQAYNEGGYGDNNIVAWCWKAGGAPTGGFTGTEAMVDGVETTCSALATSAGASITPTAMSVNTKAGFSIVEYTGNGTSNISIPHGLGKRPSLLIGKNYDNSGGDYHWQVHFFYDTNSREVGYLNLTNALGVDTTRAVNDNIIEISTGDINRSTGKNIAYIWSEIPGYSSIGKWTGDGSTGNGPFIYTGFRPAFILWQNSDSGTGAWCLIDGTRDPYNPVGTYLYANTFETESTTTTANDIDFLSNGFKLRGTGGSVTDGQVCWYAAFAEQPFNFTNSR